MSNWFASSAPGSFGGVGTTISVIEDFERSDPLADYGGDTAGFDITTTAPIEGTQSLEVIQTYGKIASTQLPTTRGATYRARSVVQSGVCEVYIHSQDAAVDVGDDSYSIRFGPAIPEIQVREYAAKSLSGEQLASVSLTAGTEYVVEIGTTDTGVVAAVYDDTMTELARTPELASTTLSGGYVGFFADSMDGGTFDAVTEIAEGTPSPTQTVVEDFEHNDLSANYVGDTAGFDITTTTPLEGTFSLEGTVANSAIGSTTVTVERGYEYRFQTTLPSDDYARTLFHVQDPTPPETNCYELFFGTRFDDIYLREYIDGSGGLEASASVDFVAGTEYIVGFVSAADYVQGVVYDVDGTEIGRTGQVNSTTHTGGSIGFDVGPTIGTVWDFVTRQALSGGSPAPSGTIIDDFEDADLAEYVGDVGAFSIVGTGTANGAQAVTGSYDGTAAVAIGSLSGLSNYPTPGTTTRVAVRTDSATAQGPRVAIACQSIGPSSNRYQAFLNVQSDSLIFSKWTGGATGSFTTLASTTVSGLSVDTFYDLEIQWANNGTLTLSVYEYGGASSLAETSSVIDTTYSDGGVQMTTNGGGTAVDMTFDHWRITGKTPKEITTGGGGTPTDGDGSVRPTVSGTEYNASNFGSIQQAIDQASSGDAVVIDGTFYPGNEINPKPGVDILNPADGGTATIISDKADAIEVGDTANVHIHGLRVEGSGFLSCIGSIDPGTIRNLFITSCTLRGRGNGVRIIKDQVQDLDNIKVLNCDIHRQLLGNVKEDIARHGVIIGSDNGASGGSTTNVEIAYNNLHDTGRWIGITLAGELNNPCHDCHIHDNTIDESANADLTDSGSSTKHDRWLNHGIMLESEVYDVLVEDNLVINVQKNGIGNMGGPHDTIWRNNEVRQCRGGIMLNQFGHVDPPLDNLFENNVIRNPRKWAIYNPEGRRNTIRGNRFIGEHSIFDESTLILENNSFE
jgi:hypothetical protein